MTQSAQAVLQEALRLSEQERAEIADALWESLESAPDTSAAEIEAAWRREVSARVAALDSGKAETIPWNEVRDQLRARLSEHRQG